MSENTASSRTSDLIAVGLLVIALAAVFLVGLKLSDDGPAATSSNPDETFGVVTGGEGKVTGTPDQLTFTATITNTEPTTAAAMKATNHDVRAVTIRVKSAGVAPKDIQTTNLSIRAKYDYSSRGKTSPKLVGYVSSQRITILVRKLDQAGKTIGSVTIAAGNQVSIGGISLSISNQQDLIARARTKAVKQSKAAAVAMAEAAGQKVGELEYVEEVVPKQCCYDGDSALNNLAFRSALVTPTSASVPISPGKRDVSVTVKVRWSLAD